MGCYPQTTTQFLLKYLYLKAQELDSFTVPVTEMLQDLQNIQASVGIDTYRVDKSDGLVTGRLKADLKKLRERGFASERSSTPKIQLSHLGLFFAEQFDTPPILKEFFSNSDRRVPQRK
jgi:hypothetical protein